MVLFIDMFNDENENVRLNALSVLKKLNQKWTFSVSDDLVDSIVLSLQDQDFRVRKLAYSLVSDLHFKSILKLDQMIDLMIQMIRKGPEDRNAVHRAFTNLGRNHHELIGRWNSFRKKVRFLLG
jgi:hypothetical protein